MLYIAPKRIGSEFLSVCPVGKHYGLWIVEADALYGMEHDIRLNER